MAPALSTVQEADIVDLAHDGRGVARIDGKAVFIDGALPSERVRLRIHKRRRHMDEAGLVDILAASPDRAVPRCAHFGVCGGCSLQHLAPGPHKVVIELNDANHHPFDKGSVTFVVPEKTAEAMHISEEHN